MQWTESLWLREQLAAIPDAELFPLLDLGSSTLAFRTEVQPYIDAHVFAPLRARGGRVWHTDLKDGAGIDLCGDLLDEDFRKRLRALAPRSITAFNLIMHVADPEEFAASVLELLPPGGLLITTGPQQLPRTLDPIDNGFRASWRQAAALFPGTELVASGTIDAGNWRRWRKEEHGRSLGRTLLRLAVPFYRPRHWLEVARQVPFLFRHLLTYGLVLRKR